MSDAEQPMDHVPPEDGVAREERSELEKNVTSRQTWIRLLYMVLMALAWSIAAFIITVVVVVNFGFVLFSGRSNSKLKSLGHSLAGYLYQIAEFMTFNTETRPFPIDQDWPAGSDDTA